MLDEQRNRIVQTLLCISSLYRYTLYDPGAYRGRHQYPAKRRGIPLHEAITIVNGSVDPTNSILFNIPGPPPHVISPTSGLPTIREPVLIDGTSEPNYAGTPVVHLDGANAGNVNGLSLSGGSGRLYRAGPRYPFLQYAECHFYIRLFRMRH